MPAPVNSSSFTNAVRYMQENDLFNRGVLDALGTAPPSILLARNKNERLEKALDRTIIIGSAFFAAPLHAWLFLKLLSKGKNIHPRLMWISYKDLHTPQSLEKAITEIKRQFPKEASKIASNASQHKSQLRQKLIDAKIKMFVPDVIVESIIFGNVGWITNALGKSLTGKKQFTGEMSAVEEKKLDALYAKESWFAKIRKRASH